MNMDMLGFDRPGVHCRTAAVFAMALAQVVAPAMGLAADVAAAAPHAADAAAPRLSAPADGYLSYSGTATDRNNSRFVYGERHVLEFHRGAIVNRVVLYTCADGSPFARKVVSYMTPTAPDFELEDDSSGLREGVRGASSGRVVFFRQNGSSQEKSAPLPPTPGLVIDAGFDEFVRANWSRLMSGQSMRFHFLVPSRLESISFQVQHLRKDRIDGVPVEVVRLKLSGMLGWILPSIDVSYAAAEHVLLRYDGLSDLRDASNDNYQVIIDFPAKDRHAGTADALESARTAPLAACR
jgi:hypothetical protein